MLERERSARREPRSTMGADSPRGTDRTRRRPVRARLTGMRRGGVGLVLVLSCALAGAATGAMGLSKTPANRPTHDAGLGIQPGKIKHVWLIILENKSYDATFTGLNKNTYLWRTLPAQGVLLTNYYGTGHGSFDNYLTLISGQATQPDSQVDCPYYDRFSGALDRSKSLSRDRNDGQFVSAQGPNAAPGSNGCVYPASVTTLFHQLDAAHVSWKGYAQDLGNPDASGPTHDAGTRYCGAPYATPGSAGSAARPNPPVANATDQYLSKHFPFPWFESILQSGDCNSRHIADLFSATHGLYHDLQHEAMTPAFSWISPNMCSDGHDAVCYGNNLSGGFITPTTTRAPVTYTGGLSAADLFLRHVIPEIEASAAFKDGGLIDITFDEAFPPFTYTGNSFANSASVAPDAASIIARDDSAGETLYGRRVHSEPTGPNTPLAKNAAGDELYPGPGANDFIDRPDDCVAQTVPRRPAGTCILLGGGHVPGARADATATAAAASTTIVDDAIAVTDKGRLVTGVGIPAGAVVGQITDSFTPATAAAASGGFDDTGSFTLVTAAGDPLLTTSPVHGVVLGARTAATDPLYNATDPTPGGGDTGSVLISPYIRPGSVSTVYYNHYSWLRTIEDLFSVSRVSRGLDGQGHIGYAAQPGLAPFGPDVFTHPQGHPVKRASARYGGIPGWLPRRTGAVDRTVRASVVHPVLAVQGDSVAVALRHGRVLVRTVGPDVPRAGGLAIAPTSASTFVVSFSSASRVVRVNPAAFTIVDELGHVHHPAVQALVGGAPPREVRPGQTVTLSVHCVLPAGNGRLTWAAEGARPIVAWDFELEII